MLIARTLPELAAALQQLRQTHGRVALVPTMGALHAGHLALLHTARQHAPAVAASIFVNPSQFGPNEDFARYPRETEADLAHLRASFCDLAWLPAVADIYPKDDATTIDPAGPALAWEGAHRPGHFRGVATVVAKLFGHVRPDAAVFGEKDWQQLCVIRRMVADLLLPVQVIGAPIVRDADGLALSSRNRFLTPAERAQAPALHATLLDMRAALLNGANAAATLAHGRASLTQQNFQIDYLALVNATTLHETNTHQNARLLAAARLGTVRLLDNLATG